MPKSIKKKECGIMKGGNGGGGGGAAPAPADAAADAMDVADVLTPTAVSFAEAESQRLYRELDVAIRTDQPVNREDLVNYLLHTYNTERIGMASVVLPGLSNFLDTFTPSQLEGGTSEFCQNLFGFRSTEFRGLLTRGASNVNQCRDAGYLRNLPLVCIWCGEPIYDMAECEHALPILSCAGLLGFSSNPNRTIIEHILEYGYAHRLCNQVKLDVPFLTWNDTNWEINWPNMNRVYNGISVARKGYKNANLLAYTYDKSRNELLDTITALPITDSSRVGPHDTGGRGNYNLRNPRDVKNRNDLTENGEHRNKTEILTACRALTTLTANLHRRVDTLVGGAKQKKTKKIKKQRGGVTHSQVLQRLPNPMAIHPDIKDRLSQTIPGVWYDERNSKLYGLYRMRFIEEYCNKYTKAVGHPKNLKYTVIARIVTSPRTKELAAAFASAGGAVNLTKIALDAYNLLQVKLQKKIREFNTYTFNITDILKMRLRAQGKAAAKAGPQLVRLQAEKQSQFDEIHQLIRDHNTKYPKNPIVSPLEDGNVIPEDATSMIEKIETHIKTLTGLSGGGKIKKMKGGANSFLAELPEGLEERLSAELTAKLKENPKLVEEEFIEEFLLTKGLNRLLEFNNFYPKTRESQEKYIAEIKDLNGLIKTSQEELDSSINTLNEEVKDFFAEYLKRNFTKLLPELNFLFDPEHPELGLNQLRIIFAAIIKTNISINVDYRDTAAVVEHLSILSNLLFYENGIRVSERELENLVIGKANYLEQLVTHLKPEAKAKAKRIAEVAVPVEEEPVVVLAEAEEEQVAVPVEEEPVVAPAEEEQVTISKAKEPIAVPVAEKPIAIPVAEEPVTIPIAKESLINLNQFLLQETNTKKRKPESRENRENGGNGGKKKRGNIVDALRQMPGYDENQENVNAGNKRSGGNVENPRQKKQRIKNPINASGGSRKKNKKKKKPQKNKKSKKLNKRKN